MRKNFNVKIFSPRVSNGVDRQIRFKLILFFLIGIISGILIYHYFIPLLKDFFSSQIRVVQPPQLSFEQPIEKETQTCEKVKNKGKAIEVNLSQQKVRMCEDGKVISEFLVSTGEKETPTPTGNFRVIYKAPIIYSKVAECWLPFWVGFTSDGQYGFHELPICNEKRVGQEEIGQPASLGCVRLKIEGAEKFYNWAEIETKVEIYGETP